MNEIVYVLFIMIASPGAFVGSWGPPIEVGEYPTKTLCQQAIADAVAFNIAKKEWVPYDSGAICIPRIARKS